MSRGSRNSMSSGDHPGGISTGRSGSGTTAQKVGGRLRIRRRAAFGSPLDGQRLVRRPQSRAAALARDAGAHDRRAGGAPGRRRIRQPAREELAHGDPGQRADDGVVPAPSSPS